MENQRLKKYFFLVFLFLSEFISQAQHPVTDEIVKSYQQHLDPEIALKEMSEKVPSSEFKHAFTLYTEGYFFKECFKKTPDLDPQRHWRNSAMNRFQMAVNAKPDEFTLDNIQKAQKFILGTYYNDALIAARSFQESNENLPYELFEIFETQIQLSRIDQPINALKSQFFKKLAERHYELWEQADTILTHPKSCIELYKKVLLQDPTDCEALQNLAVLYFNIGVNKMKNINNQADIEALIVVQEDAINLFKQALPFAESTFEDCPKTISQFKALMYIQKALGNDQEFERLKTEAKIAFPNE